MILHAEVDGQMVPLRQCEWVRWASCGCPVGVTVAGEGYAITEDEAWKAFYDRKRDSDRARRRGGRMELVTSVRWGEEIMPRMVAGCPHQAGGEAAPAAGQEQEK